MAWARYADTERALGDALAAFRLDERPRVWRALLAAVEAHTGAQHGCGLPMHAHNLFTANGRLFRVPDPSIPSDGRVLGQCYIRKRRCWAPGQRWIDLSTVAGIGC